MHIFACLTMYRRNFLTLLIHVCLTLFPGQEFVTCKKYNTQIDLITNGGSYSLEFLTPDEFQTNAIYVELFRAERRGCLIYTLSHKSDASITFSKKEKVKLSLHPLPCQGDVWIRVSTTASTQNMQVFFQVFDCLAIIYLCPL